MSITDDDDVGVSISRTSLAIEEGNSDSYTVVLDEQPAGDVTVTIAGHAGTDLTLDQTSLTFTISNWHVAQTVTATAGHDGDSRDEDEITLAHTVSSTADTDYDGITGDSVTVSISDDDDVGVSISKPSLTIEEGMTDTYAVVLDEQPAGDVTVTMSGHAGSDVSLDKTTLIFTDQDWNVEQTVTVTAEHDGDDQDEPAVTLTHAVSSTADSDYDGITADSVAITITDDDVFGVTIVPTEISLTEGQTGTYTVVLGTQPVGDVTVTMSGHASTDVSLDKTALIFTDQDWDVEQTVTVTAEHDGDDQDEAAVTLSHTVSSAADSDYDGITADSVTVTITDDEIPGVTIKPSSVTVPEGHTVQYTVVLNSPPAGEVTITVNDPTDNTDVTADPASLTFSASNWQTVQAVTVTAAADTDSDDDSATITHTVSGYGSVTAEDVAVTVTEDSPVDVSVSFEQASYEVDEGSDVTIRIVLDDDPERTLTIPLTTAEEGGATSADYSGVPAYVTFSPGDTEVEFTFTAVDDGDDDDDESVKIGFGPLPSSATAGTPSEATVRIADDELTQVVVRFYKASYTLDEGGRLLDVGVILDTDPKRSLTIPFEFIHQGGASAADYPYRLHSIPIAPGFYQGILQLPSNPG